MPRKKVSQYSKIRKRILNYISTQRRKGYEVLVDIPKTETQLRKSGIKGQALSKETRKLKKLSEQIKSATAVSLETGEITTLPEVRKARRELGAEKRRRNREAEREFWTQQKQHLPIEGEIIASRVFTDFIERLSSPAPEYTTYGSKRRSSVREVAERERITLYSIYNRQIATEGAEAVGLRLAEHEDEIDTLINYVLYGSSAEAIQIASRELAEIILGRGMNMQELIDLQEESEGLESWESE